MWPYTYTGETGSAAPGDLSEAVGQQSKDRIPSTDSLQAPGDRPQSPSSPVPLGTIARFPTPPQYGTVYVQSDHFPRRHRALGSVEVGIDHECNGSQAGRMDAPSPARDHGEQHADRACCPGASRWLARSHAKQFGCPAWGIARRCPKAHP